MRKNSDGKLPVSKLFLYEGQPSIIWIRASVSGLDMFEAAPSCKFSSENKVIFADDKVGSQDTIGIVVEAPATALPEFRITMIF